MRLLLAVSLAAIAFTAGAQSTARPRPPGTVPLAEVPPPPPLTQQSSSPNEPVVTRRADEDGQSVEEYRVRGKLYAQRVTPKHGRPYILMDHKGDGSFTKLDNSIDGHLSVPQWVLMEF
jgi:hypothetical protein